METAATRIDFYDNGIHNVICAKLWELPATQFNQPELEYAFLCSGFLLVTKFLLVHLDKAVGL